MTVCSEVSVFWQLLVSASLNTSAADGILRTKWAEENVQSCSISLLNLSSEFLDRGANLPGSHVVAEIQRNRQNDLANSNMHAEYLAHRYDAGIRTDDRLHMPDNLG